MWIFLSTLIGIDNFSLISTSNITPTPFFVFFLIFTDYIISYPFLIFLSFFPFHFDSCIQQIFTFLLLKTSANFLFQVKQIQWKEVKIYTNYMLNTDFKRFVIHKFGATGANYWYMKQCSENSTNYYVFTYKLHPKYCCGKKFNI